jgi:hypothetical protein
MASYATVPETEAEKPLLNRDVRINLKTVIGGAAVASFVLGALPRSSTRSGTKAPSSSPSARPDARLATSPQQKIWKASPGS